MIKTLLLLTAVALVQGRPSEEAELSNDKLYEPHPDCPPQHNHYLLPHEYDCTKYYYCEYGLKFIEPRDCAPGTEFNAVIQVCVHPASAGCTLPGVPTTPAVVSTAVPSTVVPTLAPSSLAPSTVEPVTAASSTLAPGTAAPSTVEPVTAAPSTVAPVTAAPSTLAPVTAAPSTVAPVTAAPSTVAPVTAAPSTLAPATSGPPTDPNPDDCEILANGCPADFHIHKLLPHEEYCNKFYYCDKGELVLRYCPEGTYFNPEIEVCDWPRNVDCVSSGTTSGPGGPSDTSSSEEIGIPSDPEDAPWEPLPNGCPADFEIHHLLPHESDCNKFYYCVFGDTVERVCPAGLHFNPVLQVCDWPRDAGCEQANVGCTTPGVGGGGCGDASPTPGDTTSPSVTDGTTPPTGGCTTPGGGGAGCGDATATPGTTPGGPSDTSSSEEIGIPSDPEDEPWVPLPNGCPADFDIHHLLPHESDCNKFYYCVHGQKIERNCAAGLHFNPVLQVCDWPQFAGCEQGNGCTSPGGSCGDTTPTPGTTPDGTPDTSSSEEIGIPSDPEDAPWVPLPNGCPADFDIHHLLPHESDCNKFYYCVHGQKVERNCAAGLHFNPVLQVCDWPRDAGCEQANVGCTTPGVGGGGCGDASPTPGDTTSPSVTDGTTPPTGGCTTPGGGGAGCGDATATPGTTPGGPSDTSSSEEIGIPSDPEDEPWVPLPNGCPADFDIHHLLPHESDCNKFYYCVHGQKVERNCAAGLHFNPVLQVCDWPQFAGCEQGNGCTSPGGSCGDTTPSPGTTPDGTPDTSSSEEIGIPSDPEDAPWEPLPNGCPADFDIHHLLPHESDCNKFYYCVHGQKVERNCAAGLHFNPALQVCDWPRDAGCEQANVGCTTPGDNGGGGCGDATPTPGNTASPPTAAPVTDGTTPPTGGCTTPGDNGGGGCVEITPTPGTTPDGPPDTSSSEEIGIPSDPEDAPWEPLPNGCPADFDIHHLLPHESDCNKFYYCVHGQKVERNCAAGLHFNPVLQVCDWPQFAGCEQGNGCTSPGGSCGDTTPTPGTTPDGTPDTSSSEEIGIPSDPEDEPWVPLPNGCPADFDIHHLLPHESDCNKFYYCVHGQKVERNCAAGLHFNPVLQVCDWPRDAGCEQANVGCTTPGEGGGSCGDATPTPGDTTSPSVTDGTTPPTGGCTTPGEVGGGCGDSTPTPGNTASPSTAAPVTDGTTPPTGGCTTPGDNGGGGCVEITPTPGTTPGGPSDTSSSEEIGIPSDPEDEPWVPLPNGCPADFDIHHLLPHESDCNKFYYCVHGQKVERNCDDGLHFNPVLQVCDWPQFAGCEQWNVGCTTPGDNGVGGCGDTTPTPSNTASPSTATPVTDGTTPPTGGCTTPGGGDGGCGDASPTPADTTSPSPATTPGTGCDGSCPINPADKCKDECNVAPWAHDSACDKYWTCDGQNSILVTCSEGLHFNPSTLTCDFICNAGCVRGSVQATAQYDGLRVFLPWDKIDKYMMSILKLD